MASDPHHIDEANKELKKIVIDLTEPGDRKRKAGDDLDEDGNPKELKKERKIIKLGTNEPYFYLDGESQTVVKGTKEKIFKRKNIFFNIFFSYIL